jgi:hypothetical protein
MSVPEGDRELVEGHLLRVTLGANEVLLWVRENSRNSEAVAGSDESFRKREPTLAIPWTVPGVPAKGIAHVPAHNTPMKPGSRERLLMAIARARKWIQEIERGQSFADLARRERKAERHIRHLAPLAFVSPRIITAIMDGTAPASLTTTALVAGLPYSWAEQEQQMGMG